MSKLQTYVLREVLKALVPGFLALLAVMMLGFGMQLLQEGLDFVRLRGFFLYMAIYCAPWVLPAALLAAVIMAFGRLSADKEILAMQVEGVHLSHILHPIYILAVIVSFIGVYLHFEGAPSARYRIESMQSEAVIQVVRDRIIYSAGRRFHVSPYMVSYERYENESMKNVSILEYGHDGSLFRIINASTGTLIQPEERPNVLELELQDLDITMIREGGRVARPPEAARGTINMRVGSLPGENEKDIKHMTLLDMRDKRRELSKEVETHERLFRNPDEKSVELNEKTRPLRAQRDKLRRARGRAQNRIANIENDIKLDEQKIENKKGRLEGWETDKMALREQRIEYGHELWEMDEEEGKGEDWLQERREVQDELEGVIRQMEELEERIGETSDELESLISANEVKKRSKSELEDEAAELQSEIRNISDEISELASARNEAAVQDDLREIEIRFHRRLTLAFAALAFTVLGIPLGLFSKRRSTLVAFGAGFFVMLAVFYPFMVLGQIMAGTGIMHVVPAMWMGNGITALIGAGMTLVLFRR